MRMILMIGTAALLTAASMAMAETALRVAGDYHHISVNGPRTALAGW